MVSKHTSERIWSQENFKLTKRTRIAERKALHERIRMALEKRDIHMYVTGNIGYEIFSIKWEQWILWTKKKASSLIPAELHQLKTYPQWQKCWKTGFIPLYNYPLLPLNKAYQCRKILNSGLNSIFNQVVVIIQNGYIFGRKVLIFVSQDK